MPFEACRIEMLGGLRVICGDRVIDRFRTRKAASLLARLALFPDRAHPREELISLLWPEMDVEAGRVNLRQALSALRHLIDDGRPQIGPVIIANNSVVRLEAGFVVTDVAEFEDALRSVATNGCNSVSARERALELYRGELMNGFYDEWIFPERRRLESLYVTALHEQQAELAGRGDMQRAIPYALKAVQMDPYDEEGHLAVMRLHAAAGDPTAVRRQFDQLVSILKEELDADPSDETRASGARLVEEAKANEPALSASALSSRSAPGSARLFDSVSAWRRAAAGLAACACMAAFITFPILRAHRSRASQSQTESPEERSFDEIRALRSRQFEAGTPLQQESARRRHAQLCVGLAERGWNSWYGHDEEKWLQRFTASQEELRVALRWLIEHDPERACLMCGALARFWYVRGFPREGYRWLNEALTRTTGMRSAARARALVGASWLSPDHGRQADAQCREAISIFEERGDKWGIAHALRHQGLFANEKADRVKSWNLYARALLVFEELKDERGQAVTLLSMSFIPTAPPPQFAGASSPSKCGSRSLALFRKLGNPWGISMSLHSLAVQANSRQDYKLALALTREALAANPEGNGLTVRENADKAYLAAYRGDVAAERDYFKRALQIARDQDDRQAMDFYLASFATLPARDVVTAARLFAGAVAIHRSLGLAIDSAYQSRVKDHEKELRRKLGDKRYDAAYREGSKLTLERAVDEAIAMN